VVSLLGIPFHVACRPLDEKAPVIAVGVASQLA
jgi:hypothetical protein